MYAMTKLMGQLICLIKVQLFNTSEVSRSCSTCSTCGSRFATYDITNQGNSLIRQVAFVKRAGYCSYDKRNISYIKNTLTTPRLIMKYDKQKIKVHKTQPRKLKTKKQTSPNTGTVSCAPEGLSDPDPHVAPFVLPMLLKFQ